MILANSLAKSRNVREARIDEVIYRQDSRKMGTAAAFLFNPAGDVGGDILDGDIADLAPHRNTIASRSTKVTFARSNEMSWVSTFSGESALCNSGTYSPVNCPQNSP